MTCWHCGGALTPGRLRTVATPCGPVRVHPRCAEDCAEEMREIDVTARPREETNGR